jgi:hypothetical protein
VKDSAKILVSACLYIPCCRQCQVSFWLRNKNGPAAFMFRQISSWAECNIYSTLCSRNVGKQCPWVCDETRKWLRESPEEYQPRRWLTTAVDVWTECYYVGSRHSKCSCNGNSACRSLWSLLRHKLYSRPQCNLFISSFFFSLSQHVSAVYGYHQVFLCQNCFTVWYIPLLLSHMNAIYPDLK